MFDEAQEVTTEVKFPYHGIVGNGEEAESTCGCVERTRVRHFFRLLKNTSVQTSASPFAAPCPPCDGPESGVRPVMEIVKTGVPGFNRYTYHRFGMLYVQDYVAKNRLKAWCCCGNWIYVHPRELDRGAECCKTCRMDDAMVRAVNLSSEPCD